MNRTRLAALVALALTASAIAAEPVRLPDIAIGPERVELVVEPFTVTDPDTRFVTGRRQAPLDFDASRVQLLRGTVAGRPGSHAFIAITAAGYQGYADMGDGTGRRAFSTLPPAAQPIGAPPPPDFCGLADEPPAGGVAGGGQGGGGPPRQVEIAVETDYEYYELFNDAGAAAEYIVTLYGAIGDIYLRDLDTRLVLNFVRVWEEPENLYDASDPLGPFRDHWNAEMTDVERDVAQLLTGRRNLPYGGVAWLAALCGDHGYSVNGYIVGSFVDPIRPSSGNWDIIVTSHELGHNCGTGHTHSYGIDNCAGGDLQRGTIMSYCHTTSGGSSNIDLRFHSGIQVIVRDYLGSIPECTPLDCNGNGIADALDLENGTSDDANGNGLPDECEDCNENGTLDDADIAGGGSADVNENGIPDECEPDCNGNGTPDSFDIATGGSADLYGNGVPDECEPDCNGLAGADYNEIQVDMSLDIDRNAVLDDCQDCDGDGVTDAETLAGGLNLWVAGGDPGRLREFHAATGVPVKDTESIGGTGEIQDVALGPDGLLYATTRASAEVVRYDPISGVALGTFITADSGGLANPSGLLFEPGGTLLVASAGSDAVLRFDGSTGDYIGAFVPSGVGGLTGPIALARGPNDNLFVTTTDDRVLEFDGGFGFFIRVLVDGDTPGGLTDPRGLLFKPDGNLLVASSGTHAVLEYDGTTGDFLGQWDRGGLDSGFWALKRPWGLQIGPRGDVVYVTSNDGNAAVHSYTVDGGLFMRSFYVLAADIQGPTGLVVMPASDVDCNMNLLPDGCDIDDGTSEDANADGIPDECQNLDCIWDVNGDFSVDDTDIGAVLNAWGGCDGCPEDVNGDGEVDVRDIIDIIISWGSCG